VHSQSWVGTKCCGKLVDMHFHNCGFYAVQVSAKSCHGCPPQRSVTMAHCDAITSTTVQLNTNLELMRAVLGPMHLLRVGITTHQDWLPKGHARPQLLEVSLLLRFHQRVLNVTVRHRMWLSGVLLEHDVHSQTRQQDRSLHHGADLSRRHMGGKARTLFIAFGSAPFSSK
jgi:hypothetical protein